MWTSTEILVHCLMFTSLFFEVLLLITFLEHRASQKGRPGKPARYPSATVVVPCFNEERTLPKTVASLLSLDYPKERLEILLVDDGSTDSTWAVMQKLAERNPELRIVHKENGGKHTALNYGIEHSQSELIGCLDSDSIVHPNALNEIAIEFERDERIMAVIPAIIVNEPRTILQWMQKAEYTLSVFIRNAFSHLEANFITPGPFSFFRRTVFETIGTYQKAHNTEDMEMAMRMQYHHMKIGNAPRAFVYTNTPPTLPKLVRQRVRWSYGFLRNFIDYRGKLVFRRQYGNIGLYILPMAFFSIFGALTLTGVALYSLIALAAEHIERIRTVGFSSPSFSLDWFFLNTESMIFLMVIIIGITMTFMLFGKMLLGERAWISPDMVLYALMYGFVAPIWLAKSVYNATLSRESSWTAERSAGRKQP